MESTLKCCVVQGTNMDKTVFDPHDHLKKIQTYPGTIGSKNTTQEVKILTEKPDPYNLNDRADEDGSQVFEENRGAVVLNPCVSGRSSRFDLSEFIRDLEHRQDIHEREEIHPEHIDEAVCYQQVSTNTRKMYSYTNNQTASDDGRLNPQARTEGGDNALCEKYGHFTKNATGHPQRDCAANKVNTMYRDHAVTDRTLAKGVDDVTGLGHKATQHSTNIPDVNAENEETRETCGTLDDTNEMFRARGQYRQTCAVCNDVYPDRDSLLKHALIHEKENKFICLFCKQPFDMQYNFKTHILLLRGEKPKVCKACKRVSEEVSVLQHKSSVQSKTCEFVERTRGELLQNEANIDTRVEDPHQSETYSELLTDTTVPNSHVNIQPKGILKEKAVSNGQTNENQQESDNCKESLTVMSRENDHIHIQAVERLNGSKGCQESFVSHADVQNVFECKVCHKLLTDKSTLKRHYRVHTEERPFECTECYKSFRWKSALTVHIRVHTEEKPFKCKECQKSFREKTTLDRHARIHTDERPYQCEHCEKSFRRMNTLQNHARIHTGEKPYECKQCGKSFRQKANLKTHARIHTGEKTFECKQCGTFFRQNASLKRHARIHTGEKPFKCKQCDKTFRKNVHLKEHARIHTGEKTFECKQCGTFFRQSTHLKEHARIHTGEKTFKCKQCGKSFRRNASLKKHARIHTG